MGKKKNYIRQRKRRDCSVNTKELASCYGKIRHSDYEAAKRANAQKIEFVKPYKCKFCDFYHVGRRPRQLVIS